MGIKRQGEGGREKQGCEASRAPANDVDRKREREREMPELRSAVLNSRNNAKSHRILPIRKENKFGNDIRCGLFGFNVGVFKKIWEKIQA